MNAETRESLLSVARKNALQWGRVLMNAETFRTILFVSQDAELQWGRVLMNAETSWGKPDIPTEGMCFNGAAFS